MSGNLLHPDTWERVNARDHTVVAPLGAEEAIMVQLYRLDNVALARIIEQASLAIQGRIEDGVTE